MNRATFFPIGLVIALAPQSAWAQDTDWSGPYLGVTTGVFAASTQNVDNWCWGACDGPTIQANKPTVGGTIGFNQKVDDSLVVGLEADFNSGGSKAINTPSSGNASPMPVYTWTADYKWTSSARARIGLTTGNSMVYVTGGYSVARAAFSEDTANYPPFAGHPGPFGANWSGTLTGYTYGVGIEHSFGQFSAKAEVLHSTFGVQSVCYADTVGPTSGQCLTAFSTEPPTLSFVPKTTAIRFGVNYRF